MTFRSFKTVLMVLGAALACLTANAWAMTFEKQERCVDGLNPKCQLMILAIGQIDKDTPKQFKSFAQDFPRGTWVAVSSPCLLYTSPSPRDRQKSRMPSSA